MSNGRITIVALLVITFTVMYSCVEPFSPPEVNSDEGSLVVDGFLNVGSDTSRIELRRTQNVNQNSSPIVETGAQLTVEQEGGGTSNFIEEGKGLYVLPPKQFSMTSKYRLRIKTLDGQEYLSDYVAVSVTPAIDSVTYKYDARANAMTFYINTHDDQSRTQFYRWKFDETWEYRSSYYSDLEVIDGEVVIRKENINRCWGNKKSASILLGSTVKLSSDVIKDLPLNIVPVITNKLYRKYSIIIKQYGLSRQAFEYWTSLSKTTQGTGSLFDPLPSQVTGNILNTGDNKQLVFGYFSASTEESKRITITPNLGAYIRCVDPDTLPIHCYPGEECATITSGMLLNYWGLRSDSVLVAPASCADCRLEGGTTQMPAYWEP
jgi:tetrahydromethanopterin S-methyltransferase subunit B